MKRNPNRGTPRGRKAIRASIAEYGAGRSILVDKHGEPIAGHHTAEAADQAGLRRRVVQTDGQELVVVRRTDLDAAAEPDRATGLALADNRAGELNRRLDAEVIKSDEGLLKGARMQLYAPVELADVIGSLDKAPPPAPTDGEHTIRIPVTPDQHARWSAWLARCATLFPEAPTPEARVLAAVSDDVSPQDGQSGDDTR